MVDYPNARLGSYIRSNLPTTGPGSHDDAFLVVGLIRRNAKHPAGSFAFSGTGTPACALFVTPQSSRSWLTHEIALNNRKRTG
jgi:hypothetical protein